MRTPAKTSRSAAALAALAVLVLAGCTAPGGEEEAAATPGVTADTVTIGTHQPLSGPAAAGYSAVSAATSAYFAYVNAGGGVNGRSIEYLVKDDAYEPQQTNEVVTELVEDDEVLAIVNGLGTPTHSVVLDYLADEGVPDLFIASGSRVWNQPALYPNAFGYNAEYTTEGAALAQYALEREPGAKVCVLGQADDYGEGLLEGVEAVLGGNEITEIQTYATSATDLTVQMGVLKAAGCEVNILGTINGFTALAVGTAAQMDWSPQWYVSSSGADYPTLVGHLGEEAAARLLEGMVCVNYLPFGPDSEWTALFRQINEEYNGGAPFTANTVLGMSVGYLFAEALAAAGEDPTRESLIAAVESGSLQGNGIVPLSFSETNHGGYSTVGIMTVEDGVQDYNGTTYRVEVGQVTEVEADPVPLVNGGIPAG
ncbi:amino acid/amide ABC transporter substrate-binding protein, HAAT family [Glycomyces sambucus]|uniref:Amino acid/amide ABC transporter substrate-binding protein, HAAT family n=1 Tax=Glycomyces sambucus TaxID=380244 RepID=A0A1G9IH22_9ACTN|nr:ABC transporter substrate-binding protein [Glycomyces sambucus]SDL24519.1 amino acid/amide ABC transporter substrate-binding protein, HAAT family [Glycomyces sambucus]